MARLKKIALGIATGALGLSVLLLMPKEDQETVLNELEPTRAYFEASIGGLGLNKMNILKRDGELYHRDDRPDIKTFAPWEQLGIRLKRYCPPPIYNIDKTKALFNCMVPKILMEALRKKTGGRFVYLGCTIEDKTKPCYFELPEEYGSKEKVPQLLGVPN